MNNFSSPFLSEIKQCKASMRKLRKKIYKYSISKRNKGRKTKDVSEEVLAIFKERKIPNFIQESLQKRRNFDFASLKNIGTSSVVSLSEIMSMVNAQETETSSIYFEHKQRMSQIKKKSGNRQPFTKKNLSSGGIYSTTEEEDFMLDEENNSVLPQNSLEQSMDHMNYYENLSEASKEPIFTDNHLHFESSINSELVLFPF